MRIKVIILFFMFSVIGKTLSAQLLTGSKVPKISVTAWLSKDGKEPDLKGKFIVAEFWATWCVPCLEALPHLNELQRNFAKADNLIFLSITDENIMKINTITKRFKFNSYIVSDTTKKTSDSFQIKYLPTTFLIDDSGMIKWVGMPRDLNKELLKSFINNESNLKQSFANEPIAKSKLDATNDSLRIQYINIFYDPNVTEYFKISILKNKISSKSAQKISNYVYNRYEVSIKLKNLLANLTNSSPVNINLPVHLEDQYIGFCYKQDGLVSIDDGKNRLLERILKEENLKYSIEKKMDKAYIIKAVDTIKLFRNKSIGSNAMGNVSVSDDGRLISIHNGNIKDLIKEIEISLGANLILDHTQNDQFRYDLTINLKNYDTLSKSLNSYGLSISREMRKISKLIFYN